MIDENEIETYATRGYVERIVGSKSDFWWWVAIASLTAIIAVQIIIGLAK